MPLYEYACTSCGERTEARQSFDEPPLEICPHCGGRLRKLYSPVGIVFKGSGFYSTDAKSKPSPAKPDKKAESAKTAKTDTADTGSTSSATAAPSKTEKSA